MTDNIYSEEFAMALSFALGYVVLIGLIVSWAISDFINNKKRRIGK